MLLIFFSTSCFSDTPFVFGLHTMIFLGLQGFLILGFGIFYWLWKILSHYHPSSLLWNSTYTLLELFIASTLSLILNSFLPIIYWASEFFIIFLVTDTLLICI